jgi:hypothetical protein
LQIPKNAPVSLVAGYVWRKVGGESYDFLDKLGTEE